MVCFRIMRSANSCLVMLDWLTDVKPKHTCSTFLTMIISRPRVCWETWAGVWCGGVSGDREVGIVRWGVVGGVTLVT